MSNFEIGDRVRNKIAPEMTGEVVRYIEDPPGWFDFKSDAHGEDIFQFHEDSFEKE